LRESENWVALAVYLAVGVVVGELATRSRRLARQAVEAETLRQSDAAKTAVLRAVSHDLRSPLTAIRAASEGLTSDALDLSAAERDALFETIRDEIHRLERLVDNLLDLSRLEAGPAARRPELWSADALVVRALDQLGADAERVDAELGDGPALVRVDAAQVERVLVNLLENALKFSSPADRVLIAVESRDDRVELRVRDRGPGVPEADRDRIFDAFERGDGTTGGSGLGLAIARGFAGANGGRISVAGETGAGATFVLELPAAEEAVATP
jgi:two-component system sensor histidine kinase KdpD